jgi:Protein of unknown function (DUF4235)
MSGKRGNGGSKALTALVGFAAAFAARKLLHIAWKQVTGREPPEHPEDPQVALGEAVTWALVLGVGVQMARMLATRAATKRVAEPSELE